MKYGKRREDRLTIGIGILILIIAALMWASELMAATQVYLEDEKDLRNGYKLCIYSEGVTITIPSYKICPISIEVE